MPKELEEDNPDFPDEETLKRWSREVEGVTARTTSFQCVRSNHVGFRVLRVPVLLERD